MSRPIIAIDVDDVLAASAEGFVRFSNTRWGTNLVPEDYNEHWYDVWKVDHDVASERNHIIWTEGAARDYNTLEESQAVLTSLASWAKLVIVTSRPTLGEKDTRDWLSEMYGDIFEDIVFAGFYDKGSTPDAFQMTKGDILVRLGADFLIDDQPKHCFAAADKGIRAVLFGDYPWSRDIDLPAGVTKCLDWPAVQEYFDAVKAV